jgi:hypothetical protein
MAAAESSVCDGSPMIEDCGPDALVGASLRTEEGTSGRGASSATNLSMSTLRAFRARPRTRSWFSIVRWGRSIRTALRLSSPEASSSKIRGNFRQARAAWMRFDAASSENRRVPAIGEERSVPLRGVKRAPEAERGQVRH